MGLKTWLVIIPMGVLAATVSFLLYEPIPEGFSPASAKTIRTLLAGMNVVKYMGMLSELVGYDSALNISRSVIQYVARKAVEKPLPGVLTKDAIFNGVRVRLFEPVNSKADKRPGFVFYHGGGWCIASVDSYQAFVGKMCNDTGTVFISVEYRLSPEFPYPAAFDDSLTATKYFLQHASEYRVDPQRIAIGGDSAGGNLAAAVALWLRDESFIPTPRLQVLIYPSLQLLDFTLPSMIKNARGPLLSMTQTTKFKSMYMTGRRDLAQAFLTHSILSEEMHKELSGTFLNISLLPTKYIKNYSAPNRTRIKLVDLTESELEAVRKRMLSPYASPLLARSLKDLPHTYLFTCEHDVLRDEGFLYARRLQEAGVRVEHVNSNIGFHGVMGLHDAVSEASDMLESMLRYIAQSL